MGSSLINVVRKDISLSHTNSESIDATVVELLEKLSSLCEIRGYSVLPYTQESLKRFKTLAIEKKEGVEKQLKTSIRILMLGTEIEKENPSDGYPERRLIEQALDLYGYELRDEDFWTRIKNDELVEIYNSDDIQIFRTFNFFKTSSYSILDLLTNEWYHLWERPTGTLDNMYKLAADTYSGVKKGIHPAGVPKHMINEIFKHSEQDNCISRSSLCEFGIVCPVYNKTDDQIGGLLITAKVTPMLLGEEAKSISFI